MAQIYQKHQTTHNQPSLSELTQSPTTANSDAEAARVLQETKAFVDDRDTLLLVIDKSDQLLGRLQDFGQEHWMLAYPKHAVGSTPSTISGPSHHLRRIASEFETGMGKTTTGRPACHGRALTTFESTTQENHSMPSGALNILAVDHSSLPGRRTSGTIKDIESSLLMRQSLASMLCSRLEFAQSHLHDLRTRVIDRDSRILVTGDLNAGKSTFVNALLGRDVAPTDQQPCTEVMCEILDSSHNGSKEEIHAILHGSNYEIENKSTYEIFELERLSELVSDVNEDDKEEHASPYQLLKVYIASPTGSTNEKENEGCARTDAISLLRNGDISVSFIDSPGLNRDTLSTMELFSKQSTIDVVVFVVSAENQFTLSAQEFLWAASQEKAYVFVVVNKWAAIRDKTKAERRIRDQLRKLSPGTWEERSELVHFVDAQAASAQTGSEEAFDHLQRSLSSFVFLRRAISKLQPAQTYTRHLLQDLMIIAQTNSEVAEKLHETAHTRLNTALPRYEKLLATSAILEESVGTIEEETVSDVQRSGKHILVSVLTQIKQGQLPTLEGKSAPYFPTYDGLLTIFQYAEDVRKAFLNSLEDGLLVAEDVARESTAKAVGAIRHGQASSSVLSETSGEVTERKFNPKAMFARRRRFVSLVSSESRQLQEFAAATASLGLASFSDLIDLDRLNWFASPDSTSKLNESESSILTGSSIVGSIGFGTLTLFGTGVAGGRAFVEGLVKLTEILGTKGARKWTGAAIGVMTIGFGIYLINDIPRAIPQNIGKKLERELNDLSKTSSSSSNDTTWVDSEVDRLTKETRKVIRLAAFDLRSRFKTALEEVEIETEGAKSEIKKAIEAIKWLESFGEEVSGLKALVDGVHASGFI
ncbi:hypothetical protein CROQUDRAFT_38205 [Cronartium quercuum f. sp. fusiforme G11]|uniref:Dynamin-type G domain-containing protein n=1 Tax=Cronartium quercuum f. sp. fusiforme G11 TaxID=708437 RepID=A0A9P6TFJ5_9BASI|nr:hypothetical protein CROQUDRAFT_38205 [Cronartium quercuum f. sp. fusiforme G11]